MVRDLILKMTAIFAIAICALSFQLLETEYWIAGIAAFGLAAAWLMSFVQVNLRRWFK